MKIRITPLSFGYVGVILLLTVKINAQAQYTYTSFNIRGANDTTAAGIDGTNIVGQFNLGGGTQSFLFNGTNYTTLSVPTAVNTYAFAISGTNIVGSYTFANNVEHGFLYNGSTYTTFNVPGANNTYPDGISGNNIVGGYGNGAMVEKSFLFNGASYITLSVPGAVTTYAYGVSGGNIVGFYNNGSSDFGFLAQPIPVLNISFSQTNLLISWFTKSSKFALYQNSVLSTTNWVIVTNTPVITNGQNQIILSSPQPGNCFYQLRSQ